MASAHQVTVTWDPPSPAIPGILFNVRRGTAKGNESSTPLNASPIAANSFVDTNVFPGKRYVYEVTSVVNGQESAESIEFVSDLVPFPPSPSSIDLTSALASFLVFGGQSVTNTGPSSVGGDVGVSPGTSVTGFPPGIQSGVIHNAGAVDFVAKAAANALSAALVATFAATNPGAAAATELGTAVDIGGKSFTPGVYHAIDSMGITGRVVLDAQGDPNAVFIFQIGTALTMAGDIVLIGGAQAQNVYWAVGSSASIGAGSIFVGILMAQISITLVAGASVNGRVLALTGGVTMDTNSISLFVTSTLKSDLLNYLPDTFYPIGAIIYDCVSKSYQYALVAGTSGSTPPIFQTGPNSITKDGPTLIWGDPPVTVIVVSGVPASPPNVPPPPPPPPTNLRLLNPES
jgi:hypothetical protein